jgi:hypothetical protein
MRSPLRPALLVAVAALALPAAVHAQDFRTVQGTATASVRSIHGWEESIDADVTLLYSTTDGIGAEHYILLEARLTWRAEGTTGDGCEVSGTALVTETDPFAANMTIGADASYRGGSGAYELAADPERITVTCPGEEPFHLPAGLLEFLHVPTGPERGGEPFRYVEQFGVRAMEGTWGSGEPGDPRFTWRLAAEPPPTPSEPGAPGAPAALAVDVAPNPARGAAEVRVDLPVAGPVRVAVYDALGRTVAVLAEGPMAAGPHALRLDAGALPPGVYVVRAAGAGTSAVRRITVAR